MACRGAGKHLEIAGIGMAIGTTGPFPFMLPGIDRKPVSVMVECRRNPCVLIMAIGACCGKTSSDVIGIGGLVVIGLVASVTGIRGAVVISVMALRAGY